MRTKIFYFTGTGNSLKLSKDIAAQLGDCECLSIPKALKGQLDLSCDKIGIVFPVYMFGPPLIVTKFIKKLGPQAQGKYIFCVANFGGMAGGTLDYINRQLRLGGQKLSAAFLVTMPGNYTPLYEAIPLEKQENMFKEAQRKVKDIALIVSEEKEYFEKKNSLFNFIFSRIYAWGAPKIPYMDKEFLVEASCNSCGICAQVCPVGNIEIKEGKPKWMHKCEQCFACLHWCPQEAIQYGSKTKARRRYRNPHITVSEIISSK